MQISCLNKIVFYFTGLLLFTGIVCSPGHAQVIINEVCASNSSLISDQDGDFPDWIEITNTGNSAIDLAGYSLRDDREDAAAWIFPRYLLQPGEYHVLFASGKNLLSPPLNWKAIVSRGDTWKYRLPDQEIPGWNQPGYDDSQWLEGPSGIGYSDGDDATVIPPVISLYMRIAFDISDSAFVEEAALHMDYDDGFVAYLNGVEIARKNMKGDPAYDDLATEGHEARIYLGGPPDRFDVENPSSLLVNGENVLAVEVHNVSETSSDLSAIPFFSIRSQVQPGAPPSSVLQLSSGRFHTNFRLDADSDTLYLSDAGGKDVDSLYFTWQATDHSFGRVSDQAWYLFGEPTPGQDNDTETYYGYSDNQLIFSRPGGRFSEPFELTISSDDPLDTIYFTTDGTVPDTADNVYKGPLEISSDTVIRARIFQSGYLPVRPVVQSYVMQSHDGLPLLSLTTDPSNFWDHQYGIYAMGPNAEDNFPHFGANFWNDWERPVHLEMYDEHDSLAFSIDAGVKIYGGWTRGYPQKSLSVFARAKYGDRNIPYQLFPGKPANQYEAFVLRNSGNDWFGKWNESGTMFRDALMTGLTRGMDLEYQQVRQAVLYINGEYWGIHNIREKINEHFLAANTGVEASRVELLTNNQQAIIGNNTHYRQLIDYVRSSDLSDAGRYAFVKQQMEVDNFIKYQVAEIYFGNTDWPGNNVKYWRPAYNNGRWRWILYDTDFGFGLRGSDKVSENTLNHALASSSSDNNNPPWSTLLLRKLLNNQEFKHQFINSFADHINTSFKEERVDQMIEGYRKTIVAEMVHHSERWGGNFQTWNNKINDLKNFAAVRPAMVQGHIISRFDLDGKHDLTVRASGDTQGVVKLNTLLIKNFPWTGTYFDGVPVELAAVPSQGYKFTGWSGDFQSEDSHILIDPASVHSLTAHFEPVENAFYNRIIINEICYAPDSANSSEDWVELYNRSSEYVDLSGWKIQDSNSEHVYRVGEGTVVQPHGYYVFCRNRFKYRELHTEFEDYQGNFEFGLSSLGDIVRLYDHENRLINLVSYEVSDPWPVIDDGFTLSLIDPEKDNFIPGSWAVSEEKYGTPGRSNFGIPDGLASEEVASGDLLLGNHPNPFTRSTTVTFYADSYRHLKLAVYDLQGRLVEVLAERRFEEGTHEINWTPGIASGMYILKMETPGSVHTLRLLKVK